MVSAREEAGLGVYRRMGVTGGRFPSPGRQCGAGGVRNRDSRSPAALAHGGVLWRLFELARARGDLRERHRCIVSAIPGALECGLGWGAIRGRPGGAAGGRGAGKEEGGERCSRWQFHN